MPRKQYTEAEKAAYKAGLAAKGGARSRGTAATRTKKRTAKTYAKGKAKGKSKGGKRSGCIYYEHYTDANGNRVDRPKVFGWRYIPGVGRQTFNAYLDKNDGAPRNPKSKESGESCRVFVVNLVTEGIGEATHTGVYSLKYRKLSITKLGLVANPFTKTAGGYFGKGGARYRNKIKK